MQYAEALNELRPRVQRLGLVDQQTGFYDDEELLAYMYMATRWLKHRYQLQHFLDIDRELFRTESSVETYALPDNVGFIAPAQTRQSGLAVRDTSTNATPTNLLYYDPARYNLYRTTTTGKPAWFTLANNLIWLQPIPDTAYIVEGIIRPLETVDIPEPYVVPVQLETLHRLASDCGKLTPMLHDEYMVAMRTMVNNEARFKQRFYTNIERIGMHRGYRRGYR